MSDDAKLIEIIRPALRRFSARLLDMGAWAVRDNERAFPNDLVAVGNYTEADAREIAECMNADECITALRAAGYAVVPTLSDDEWREVEVWCAKVYAEKGVSPALRKAYEFYLANFGDGRAMVAAAEGGGK